MTKNDVKVSKLPKTSLSECIYWSTSPEKVSYSEWIMQQIGSCRDVYTYFPQTNCAQHWHHGNQGCERVSRGKILEIGIIFKFQCLVPQCLVSSLRHYPEIQDIRIEDAPEWHHREGDLQKWHHCWSLGCGSMDCGGQCFIWCGRTQFGLQKDKQHIYIHSYYENDSCQFCLPLYLCLRFQ